MSESRVERSWKVIPWMRKRICLLLSFTQEQPRHSSRQVSRKSRVVRPRGRSFDSSLNNEWHFKDIRKSRKWLSVEEIRLLALVLFIFVVLLAANIALALLLDLAGSGSSCVGVARRAFLEAEANSRPYGTEMAQQMLPGSSLWASRVFE